MAETAGSPVETLLITRHPGARVWLQQEAARRRWQPARSIAHLGQAEIGRGTRVAGTIPLVLMARLLRDGVEVWHLHLPQAALAERGQEHSAEAMTARGARLVRVRAIDLDDGGA